MSHGIDPPGVKKRVLLRLVVQTLLILVVTCESWRQSIAQDAGDSPTLPLVTIVTLGDSITKGERPGVRSDETFASLLEHALSARGTSARIMNAGVGGERTDLALTRLESIIRQRPQWVTVMYGTNDSYVDQGKDESRLSVDAYRANLRQIVTTLLREGIEPILMTEPRWAKDARNGLGENPNHRLEPLMDACREVAHDCGVPLIDHFANWTNAEKDGVDLAKWTTDGCHPNPLGHQQIANLMVSRLSEILPSQVETVGFQVKLETALEHDDGDFLWFHPRATAILRSEKNSPPAVLMTLQKHLYTSDHYSGLYFMTSHDLGQTWTRPELRPELDWVRDGDVDIAVADVTPGWDSAIGRVIAVGAQVRYSTDGRQLEDQPRAHQTAYAMFDPVSGEWTRWRRLAMPADDAFNFSRCACAQFLFEPDGTLLLPLYIARSATVPFEVTVAQCTTETGKLTYRQHGTVLRLPVDRGLCEPSLIRIQGRYFLTLRNDVKAYVTFSDDGLHFRPIKPWLFDNGEELGSYNTQQHWLSHGGGLFLVYTRRGANNDHVFRHRSPLFIAQVDPRRLCVLRSTERVLVPERGATLGNFGAAAITEHESWVTVAEGIWNDSARKRGAKGAVFVARVVWSESN